MKSLTGLPVDVADVFRSVWGPLARYAHPTRVDLAERVVGNAADGTKDSDLVTVRQVRRLVLERAATVAAPPVGMLSQEVVHGHLVPDVTGGRDLGSAIKLWRDLWLSRTLVTPAIQTASGPLTITPLAGSGLAVVLTTTGDFTVNTTQLVVDTSTAFVGVGIAAPASVLHVRGATGLSIENFNNSPGATALLNFVSANTTPASVTYARMNSVIVTRTAGAEDGDLVCSTMRGGVLTEGARLLSSGLFGVGVVGPTARLHLAAGTATANTGPLKFTSGTVLGTPEAGAVEYNGRFTVTDTDAARRHVVQAVASTKTTAGAPYANDGYIEVVIDGTTRRVMTTA